MAAWYYVAGLGVLLLVVIPASTDTASWSFNRPAIVALAIAIPIWPVCAFLLTYANENATPTTVTVFAPAQIVFTFLFEFGLRGNAPSRLDLGGATLVVLGLLLFCCGQLEPKAEPSDKSLLDDENLLHAHEGTPENNPKS